MNTTLPRETNMDDTGSVEPFASEADTSQSTPVLTIQDTDASFEYWLAKPYISDDLRAQLQSANALIVPSEESRPGYGPLFPRGTIELLQFLRRAKCDDFSPDICISDDEYSELTLHSIGLVLGGIVVTSVALPVLVNLISEYLKQRVWPPAKERTSAEFELTVTMPSAPAKRLHYRGPVDQVSEVLADAVTALSGKDAE